MEYPKTKENEAITDITLVNQDGEEVKLSDYWRSKTTVFVFVRHFGCPHCRAQLTRLNHELESIKRKKAQLVAIGMGDLEKTRQFHQVMSLNYPLLSDKNESAYDLFQLTIQPDSVKENFQAFLRDAPFAAKMLRNKSYGPFLFAGDKLRHGGTFIINTEGRFVFAHRDQISTDIASLEDILNVL